jgi:hypothetical protein
MALFHHAGLSFFYKKLCPHSVRVKSTHHHTFLAVECKWMGAKNAMGVCVLYSDKSFYGFMGNPSE